MNYILQYTNMNNMFVKNFEIIKHEFDPCEDYIHIERTHNKNEAKVFETKNKDITNELESDYIKTTK